MAKRKKAKKSSSKTPLKRGFRVSRVSKKKAKGKRRAVTTTKKRAAAGRNPQRRKPVRRSAAIAKATRRRSRVAGRAAPARKRKAKKVGQRRKPRVGRIAKKAPQRKIRARSKPRHPRRKRAPSIAGPFLGPQFGEYKQRDFAAWRALLKMLGDAEQHSYIEYQGSVDDEQEPVPDVRPRRRPARRRRVVRKVSR